MNEVKQQTSTQYSMAFSTELQNSILATPSGTNHQEKKKAKNRRTALN